MTHDTDKLIRQLSLVAYLMAEQRPVTARDVKMSVEGYQAMGDEAFARRFYADRSELQGLGVPVTSHRDDFTGEEIYTLREEHYFLPPIDLTDAELAALQTSLHLLEGQFAYAEPLRLALQNLALGRGHPAVDPGPKTAEVNLLGSGYTAEVAARLAKLETAISKGRTVRFRYWTIGRDDESDRTVNPLGLYELNGNWYVVGDDVAQKEQPRRRTFRVSRVRGEIRFATRRERDFRMPADFDVTAYRDRPAWRLDDAAEGRATVLVHPDATWWVSRAHGHHGTLTEGERDDGWDEFQTDYSALRPLSEWILRLGDRARPVDPPALVQQVSRDLERVIAVHSGPPTAVPPEPPARPAEGDGTAAEGDAGREPGPVAPERFALLQALLAFLLERCGDEESTTVPAADLEARFRLSRKELQEHLDLLNLVNFGGGCYAVYCSTVNGSVVVDKELYGDRFRRPARLSPLEAKALLRALDVVAPLLAAEAHTSLATVREKVAGAFGAFSLPDTPDPHAASAEEQAVTTLNEGVRRRRLVRMSYLSRSSNDAFERVVEPYLLRRDQRGWYVEAWDRTRDGHRTFNVARIEWAKLLDETYPPREEMRDFDERLGGDVGIAHIRVGAESARWEREANAETRMLPDGSAVARIAFGSHDWLVGELLRRQGGAELLEPARLRDDVREAAERLRDRLGSAAVPAG